MTRSNDAARPGRSSPRGPASAVTPLRVVLILALLSVIAVIAFGKSEVPPPPDPPAPSAAPAPVGAPDASEGPKREIVGAAHVLVAYKGSEGAPKGVTRSKAEARKRAETARALLVDGKSTFAEVVKKYSDDPSTARTGGAIGNFERNAMPTAFADAAFGLSVGSLSEVVETPRGFHIIKRTN